MNTTPFYRLGSLTILDFDGKDSDQILHNLTTNDVKSLAMPQTNDAANVIGSGRETFITDVRGKTLGHVVAYRTSTGYRLIGAAGQSAAIAAHADKYTIREDAVPTIRDDDFTAIVVHRSLIEKRSSGLTARSESSDTVHRFFDANDGALKGVNVYETGWLGDAFLLVLVPNDSTESWLANHVADGGSPEGEDAFHHARTLAGFPWYGIDFGDKHLPQEVDRDEATISFTKGCYLGQETVARLDALGQVQKKLVRWTVDHGDVAVGTELTDQGKVVGRLTSIAKTSDHVCQAIGIARRSHFDPGSTATAVSSAGESFTATVDG